MALLTPSGNQNSDAKKKLEVFPILALRLVELSTETPIEKIRQVVSRANEFYQLEKSIFLLQRFGLKNWAKIRSD